MYQRFRSPSFWQEMNRLQKEMNRLYSNIPTSRSRTAQSYPAINVWADENSALITAEIPGINKEELEVNVTGDTLTISGERKPDVLPDTAYYHRRERSFGKFSRNIQLPYTININKVKASFMNGLLEITLPRIDAEKPKKIAVKTR